MRAFIYTGGSVFPENITEHPKGDDLRIAADSGYSNAELLGDRVDILIGDFDSLKTDINSISDKIEKISVPAEKDETDTQIAVSVALSKGAKEIVIIGGLDGRLDHTLSNLAILEYLCDLGVHCVITSGKNRVRYLRSTSTLLGKSGYKYFSLIAADDTVKGASIEGGKYPLKNARLSRKFQYTVSNEIVGNCALISVKRGGIYIVESID